MRFYDKNNQRLVSYTKLLASHVHGGRHGDALSLFSFIYSSDELTLDPFIFPLALKSCTALRLPRVVSSIHAHTIVANFASNPFVSSALIDAYGKSTSVVFARQLFDEVSERNAVVWNTMISLYARSGNVSSAIGLLDDMDAEPTVSSYNPIVSALVDSSSFSNAVDFCRRMQRSGVKPNFITCLALLPGCTVGGNLVKEVHGFSIRSCIDENPQLSSGLMESYCKCGCLGYARKLFDRMTLRDVVAWSSMISGYALNGEADKAMKMFERMDVAPDGIMFLAILKACSHAGLADEAMRYFGLISKNYGVEPSCDHYACLVDVLSRSGRLIEAYELIRMMPFKATVKAWGALLGACRSYGNIKLAEIAGRTLFEMEPDNGGNFVILANIYASAGMFEKAQCVRKEMRERLVKRAPGSSWLL